MVRITCRSVLCVLVLAGPTRAAAQSEPPALQVAVSNLTAAQAGGPPRGQALQQGDVVHYDLSFTNVAETTARDVRLVNPIPSGLVYALGTAAADDPNVRIDFSIDGGSAFAAEPMVWETVNGEEVARPAPPERYTHLRWTVPDLLPPGASFEAEFEAQFVGLDHDSTAARRPRPTGTPPK